MKLSDALKRIPKNELIAVGAMSAFFYIGEAGDFHQNNCKCSNLVIDHGKKVNRTDDMFADREIKTMYRQDGSNRAIVLIVQGNELGLCWTRGEYEELEREQMLAKKPIKKVQEKKQNPTQTRQQQYYRRMKEKVIKTAMSTALS